MIAEPLPFAIAKVKPSGVLELRRRGMRVRNKFIKCVRRIWGISPDKEDRWRRGAVFLLLLSFGVSPQGAHGQTPATVQAHKDLSQLSMEELMKVQGDRVYGAS